MDPLRRWRAVGASTAPADRPAAERGIRHAYRLAGIPEPETIVWAASPRAGVEAVRALADPGASVRGAVRTRPWADERRAAYEELGPAGWAAHWSRTGAALWGPNRLLTDRITTAVVSACAADPEGAEGAAVRALLVDAVLGQHDAAWLAAFDGRTERLAGLAAVARHAGWWWPYERAVVVCERPVELHRDEAGRLDNGDGPALAYADGFALHAWRGMPVPADFHAELASLSPQRIRAEGNAELRRVMLEYYGYQRYLDESGATSVQDDETGRLWRIRLADDEDVVMVEVVNATPEPDGTRRTYWLRVPPGTRTARAGVAWTFGVEEDDYAPVRQT
ncbi:DUF6745 domain-containing protein [Streptomyces sp. NBC_01497]|uniref:DUF6745 domain-containing protein n=1 Tax=Streptomyces sp. NBC_01497 TaxID=2903885 RepID=UPI002E380D53|nr:hypothetical protein [Streptomyces sp. NBC_01497]